jgi:hypothetical protein
MKQLILISALCLTVIGCSNTVHVNGKVTLEDGTPVTKGFINFNNGEYEARGILFSLTKQRLSSWRRC